MMEASTTLHRWGRVVQLAIDCLGKSMAEQTRLLEDARKAGMQIVKDILALNPLEDKKDTTNPPNDLMAQAFTAAQPCRGRLPGPSWAVANACA